MGSRQAPSVARRAEARFGGSGSESRLAEILGVVDVIEPAKLVRPAQFAMLRVAAIDSRTRFDMTTASASPVNGDVHRCEPFMRCWLVEPRPIHEASSGA